MNRRQMLTSVALGMAGLTGCVGTQPRQIASAVTDTYRAPVLSSMNRVTQHVVGLRPFRPQGYRLEAQKFDDKLVARFNLAAMLIESGQFRQARGILIPVREDILKMIESFEWVD